MKCNILVFKQDQWSAAFSEKHCLNLVNVNSGLHIANAYSNFSPSSDLILKERKKRKVHFTDKRGCLVVVLFFCSCLCICVCIRAVALAVQ